MKLTWYGTAAFRISTGTQTIWIDPYLSRNANAFPVQPTRPADLHNVDAIFTSHGHFDHVMDIPRIVRGTNARVYCSGETARTLRREGVPADHLEPIVADGSMVTGSSYTAEAFPSRHVQFDKPLVAKTLLRSLFHLPGLIKYMRRYPVGPVFSWRFTIAGTTIHHFGSAGSSPQELQQLGKQTTDILLVPLQGHSQICRIALEYVRALQPSLVIPHHQDDFFPPISRSVDIEPFVRGVIESCPQTKVKTMAFNETLAFPSES